MANYAKRYHIEPMLWFITLVMMPFFGLCSAAMALQITGFWQFAGTNGVTYNRASFIFQRMSQVFAPLHNSAFGTTFKFAIGFAAKFFGFWRLSIRLSFWTMTIFCTCLARYLFALSSFLVCRHGFARHLSALSSFVVCRRGFVLTDLAASTDAKTIPFVWVKLRQRFDLLAFQAAFHYDLVSHNQLLQSWLWLRPAALTNRASGLFYYR
jgi:hypothetical protein